MKLSRAVYAYILSLVAGSGVGKMAGSGVGKTGVGKTAGSGVGWGVVWVWARWLGSGEGKTAGSGVGKMAGSGVGKI